MALQGIALYFLEHMEKTRLLGLLAALILSAGTLYAQDSGGDGSGASDSGTSDSGTSDSGTSDSGTSDNSDSAPDQADIADPTVTDPTNQNAVDNLDFAAQQAHDAITTPWGGVPVSSSFGNEGQLRAGGNPVPGGLEEPGTFSPGPPTEPVPPTTGIPPARRAQIHAVIVSNLSDPSQVLSGNVNLTGGIIALGPPTPSQKPGHWDPNVHITPDPNLLNGSKIPPLVPNVIDVRITHYEVTATIESQGSVSGQP